MPVVCSDVESLVSKMIPDLLKYPSSKIPVVARQIRSIAPCHNPYLYVLSITSDPFFFGFGQALINFF